MFYVSLPLPGNRPIQMMFCQRMISALHVFHVRSGQNAIALSFHEENLKKRDALSALIFRSEKKESLLDFWEVKLKATLEELNIVYELNILEEKKPFPSFKRMQFNALNKKKFQQKVDFLYQKDTTADKAVLEAGLRLHYESKFNLKMKNTPHLALKMKSASSGQTFKLLIAPTELTNRLDSYGLYHA